MDDSPLLVEAQLLEDALGVPAGAATLLSREPLGAGSVLAWDVAHPGDDAELRYYVDTSRLRVSRETGMLLGTPEAPEARIWLHPADPHLPALAAAAFGHSVEGLLARLGIRTTGEPEFVAYRPGRRAVLRAPVAQGTVWVKVVRPSRLERTVSAHAAFAVAGVPGPAVLGWSPEGLIVLEDAAGTPAADIVWDTEAFLDEIDRLRKRIGTVVTTMPVRGVADRLDWYAARAARLPAGPQLADRIRALLTGAPDAAPASVHGDLHFGQLFLAEDGTISAVIDVDTAGLGAPDEDAAAFIAHACASALLSSGQVAQRVWALADAAWRRWGGGDRTRALTAAHLLGHALADVGGSERAATLLGVAAGLLDSLAPSRSAQGLRTLSSPVSTGLSRAGEDGCNTENGGRS